ncbi:unnamed protein product [Parnassius mnemosyne]|uniref:Uncharacterized protein n=1 Tax=Parnassius mnemosyne TaxID=213953 RepID=A0AAV1LL42_9NEOP
MRTCKCARPSVKLVAYDAYGADKYSDPIKKAKRVRSWYLYEQYKSLEKNQLQAAQMLKDRSSQEKMLHQELQERRARRKLCNQFSPCHSESRLQKSIFNDPRTPLSASTDDFLEDFCDINESDVTIVNSDKTYRIPFENPLYYDEIYDDIKAIITNSEECDTNIVGKETEDSTLELKAELELVKKNIAENINLQMETMKENIKCLDNLTKQSTEDKTKEDRSDEMVKHCIACEKTKEYDNNLHAMWSKLVSFAYQVIQLNNGNCYYDCSSQFMTAVLACDILCKGLNQMCDILQPYVSPIKYATDEWDASSHINTVYTRSKSSKATQKSVQNKIRRKQKSKSKNSQQQKRNYCKRKSHRLLENQLYTNEHRILIEPWHSVTRFATKINTECSESSNTWLHEHSRTRRPHYCNCCRLHVVVNPMIKLSRYIDSVLKDLED